MPELIATEILPTLKTSHIRLLKQIRCSEGERLELTSRDTITVAETVNHLLSMDLVEPLEGGLWLMGGMMYGEVRLLPAGHAAIRRGEEGAVESSDNAGHLDT